MQMYSQERKGEPAERVSSVSGRHCLKFASP
jgi:hypothetical protein